jgi:hypothetical protein
LDIRLAGCSEHRWLIDGPWTVAACLKSQFQNPFGKSRSISVEAA